MKLFSKIEKVFQWQLILQVTMMVGSLVCASYLTISFAITGYCYLFTIAFLMYALVPAIRFVDSCLAYACCMRGNYFYFEAYFNGEFY
jgi:hypothetical protein